MYLRTFELLEKELAVDLPVGEIEDVAEDAHVGEALGARRVLQRQCRHAVRQQEDDQYHDVQQQLLHLTHTRTQQQR